MRSIRAIAAAVTAALAADIAGGSAHAGEFAPLEGGGGSYTFTRCTPPDVDVPTDADLERLSKSPRRRGRAIVAYNGLVDQMNAYFQCLRLEADEDVQSYYQAVEAAFQDRQRKALADVERLRRAIDDASASPTERRLEDELLGADVTPPESPPEPSRAAPETDRAGPDAGDVLILEEPPIRD